VQDLQGKLISSSDVLVRQKELLRQGKESHKALTCRLQEADDALKRIALQLSQMHDDCSAPNQEGISEARDTTTAQSQLMVSAHPNDACADERQRMV
jgi:hypothetical protein